MEFIPTDRVITREEELRSDRTASAQQRRERDDTETKRRGRHGTALWLGKIVEGPMQTPVPWVTGKKLWFIGHLGYTGRKSIS